MAYFILGMLHTFRLPKKYNTYFHSSGRRKAMQSWMNDAYKYS